MGLLISSTYFFFPKPWFSRTKLKMGKLKETKLENKNIKKQEKQTFPVL